MAAGSRVKRSGAGATRRKQSRRLLATKPNVTATSKVREIVRLTDALVDGLGVRGRHRLGRGIATPMVHAYGERGRELPRRVKELVAYCPQRDGHR